MTKSKIINIGQHPIVVISHNNEDYISTTDMERSRLLEAIFIKWLSLKNTIVYVGEWEAMYNPGFNYTEFATIKK